MQSASYSGEIRGDGHMMRHENEEEKKEILERLKEIDKEFTKNSPFHYD